MDFLGFNKVFTTDFNIDKITAVRVDWTAETRFNRMDPPRARHALFMVTDYPAVFSLPGGEQLQGIPGDVLLLPKGSRYLLRMNVPAGQVAHPMVANFRLSVAGQEVTLDDGVRLLSREAFSVLPQFTAAAQCYRTGAQAMLKSAMYAIFANLFPVSESDVCCIGYINRHYADRFSVPALAKRCAMSETAYRVKFKTITGMSPVQYINRLKVEKACQMLLSGDLNTQEVSSFLNFYSLPYFYKVFKDNMGCTPMEYLQQAVSE